jgi:peptide chain release factor 3
MFMANEKSVVDQAYPGDVVGLYDTGNFKIGDTLTEGENLQFQGIPSFSPEIFKELINKDPFKAKQLDKGIRQLTDEGVAQLFLQEQGSKKIIGTVGDLQFEVIQFRLLNEYGASATFVPVGYSKACWITSDDKEALANFIRMKNRFIAYDKEDRPVFLADTLRNLKAIQDLYPAISFHFTSEFKTDQASIGQAAWSER